MLSKDDFLFDYSLPTDDDDDPIDMCSRLIVHTIWHAHRLGYE